MQQFDELKAYKEKFEPKRQRIEEDSSILQQLYKEGSIQDLPNGSIDARKDIKERIDHLYD